MLEMGIIVALGLLVMLAKMPWKWKLVVLSYPLTFDAIVFIALTLIHWGSFSGVMVATIGAFMCSIVLSAGKWLIGCYQNDSYRPGIFDVSRRLQ